MFVLAVENLPGQRATSAKAPGAVFNVKDLATLEDGQGESLLHALRASDDM